MSYLDKNETALLIRLDERQKTTESHVEELTSKIDNQSQKIDRLDKKIDSLVNKGVGASAMLIAIGGFIMYILEKIFLR